MSLVVFDLLAFLLVMYVFHALLALFYVLFTIHEQQWLFFCLRPIGK